MSDDEIKLHMTDHTRAKHRILEEYLKGWFPILSKFKRILYLDGFAGSGEYDDGSVGSPIIALNVANNHVLKLEADEINFFFIENKAKRADYLRTKINQMFQATGNGKYAKLRKNFTVEVDHGEFNSTMSSLLSGIKSSIIPTMAFIDPFGYTDLNLDVLSKILRFNSCELLITYMVGFLDRFSFDEKHQQSIKHSLELTDQEIQTIRSISNNKEREQRWLAILIEKLENKARSMMPMPKEVYHLAFEVRDQSNRLLYHLVYMTKSQTGLEVMKEAMYRVGKDGNLRFSDYNFDPQQTSILDYSKEKPWVTEAASVIYERFKGQSVAPAQVKEFAITRTLFLWRKQILVKLEQDSKLSVIGTRTRRFTYPDNVTLSFLA
jgi:three-Cys-motif partner protein